MRVLMLAAGATLALCGCATAGSEPIAQQTQALQCKLTQADLVANRSLTWQKFDQQFDLQNEYQTTWRSLMQRKCFDEAVVAYTDYLAWGPIPAGERWQTTARFHLGQSLAHAGRNAEAARVIATARRETEVGGLKWNLYVQGTVAFLLRDKAALQAAYAALAAETGPSNATNAGVLAGMMHCWDKPYSEASTLECITASGFKRAPN